MMSHLTTVLGGTSLGQISKQAVIHAINNQKSKLPKIIPVKMNCCKFAYKGACCLPVNKIHGCKYITLLL
jgi:hypothetical protein